MFQQNEVSRGIFPFGGAMMRMPRRFGWGNAMRYLLTGDPFDVHEAHRLGLVQEIVEVGTQRERALELAGRIAEQAPMGVRVILETARIADQDAAVAHAVASMPTVMNSEDAREGVMSLMQKRKAVFTGR